MPSLVLCRLRSFRPRVPVCSARVGGIFKPGLVTIMSDSEEEVVEKATKDIDVTPSQFSQMMAFLERSQKENQKMNREQETRMAMKIEQSHDRVVQVLGDELTRTAEQLNRDLTRQVTILRQDHSAQFQTVHEDIVGIKSTQAGLISEHEDLRAEIRDKVDNVEARVVANAVNPLRAEFAAAMLAKDQEIAELKKHGSSGISTNDNANVQLGTQLAEQAKIMKQTSDQCSSLKSRLDFFEKKQAGIESRARGPTTPAPSASTRMSFAQATAQIGSLPPACKQPQPPLTAPVPPTHGLYYGDTASEA